MIETIFFLRIKVESTSTMNIQSTHFRQVIRLPPVDSSSVSIPLKFEKWLLVSFYREALS